MVLQYMNLTQRQLLLLGIASFQKEFVFESLSLLTQGWQTMDVQC